MSNIAWLKYRLKCTNGDTHFVYRDENETEPTVCPDGYSLSTSPVVVEERNTNEVSVREEEVKTGGHFRIDCKEVNVTGPTGTVFVYDFTEKVSYNILNIQLIPTAECQGECFDVGIAPDLPVGTLTDTSPTGSDVLSVSTTVTDNVEVGYYIKLYDGVQPNHECGQVLEVNKNDGTITVENPPLESASFAAGTVLLNTVFMAKDFVMPPAGIYPLGTTKIGGSYVEANRMVRLYYTKKDALDKKLWVIREWLY